jgi:hypothetical protein
MPRAKAAHKDKIPKALREQLWLQYAGAAFEVKCSVAWCRNTVTPFRFHAGHNKAEALGGKTVLQNLRVVCANCNLSMGTMSVDEFSRRYSSSSAPPHPTRAPAAVVPVVEPPTSAFSCCAL